MELILKDEKFIQSICYIHPDKEIMNEYPSPDELDSLDYAFMEIQNVIRL